MNFSLYYRSLRKVALVSSVGLISLLLACNKSEDYRFDTSYNRGTALDALMAEHNFRSVFMLAYKLSLDTSLLRQVGGFLDSAWVSGSGTHWVMVFDSGRVVPDGSRRSGKIQLEWLAPLTDSGAVAIIKFDKYRVNGKDIDGKIKISQIAYPSLKYQMQIDSVRITIHYPRLSQVRYQGSFFLRRYEGASTPYNWGDDVFKLYGQASGRGSESDRFTFTTTDSLHWHFNCRYLSGGNGLIEMPDFEINQTAIEYPLVKECSSVLRATYKIKSANGAVRKVSSENLSILL